MTCNQNQMYELRSRVAAAQPFEHHSLVLNMVGWPQHAMPHVEEVLGEVSGLINLHSHIDGNMIFVEYDVREKHVKDVVYDVGYFLRRFDYPLVEIEVVSACAAQYWHINDVSSLAYVRREDNAF